MSVCIFESSSLLTEAEHIEGDSFRGGSAHKFGRQGAWSTVAGRTLSVIEKWRQAVANPVYRLLVSIRQLEHCQVGMVFADDLHAHGQSLGIEAYGDVDYGAT